MAHLAKKGPWYIVRFTYDGKEYKKSLKTKDHEDALAAQREVENRLHDLYRQKAAVPADVDPGDYIVWGRSLAVVKPKEIPTFRQVMESYLEAHGGLKAASTLLTERVHLGNMASCLGGTADKPVDQLAHKDLEAALGKRLRAVSSTTVKKERQTLVSLFQWAARQGLLKASPAAALPTIKVERTRSAFRTLDEVDDLIRRGGLAEEELARLWECLYLTAAEIGEILGLVKAKEEPDYVHVMFAIIAYTGMRRGEMLRLRWMDVNLSQGLITARSLKQSRQRQETLREIDLHPALAEILQAYQKTRPTGQYVVTPAGSLDPLTNGQANESFRRALRGSRWEREMPTGKKKVVIGFHTFRHSFASTLAIRGVDQRIIDRWMGHQTEEMRRRYQHLFPKKLAESIRALGYDAKHPSD